MKRYETTKFLGQLMEKSCFSGPGKYWAREVSLDYGYAAGKPRRVNCSLFRKTSVLSHQSKKEYLHAMKSKAAKRIFTAEMD